MGTYIKTFERFLNEDLSPVPSAWEELERTKRKYRLKLNPETMLYDSDSFVVIDKELVIDGELIIPFGKIKGYFSCASLHLTSLKGCPREVGGDFYCQNNDLTTLEYAPEKVGGKFWCANNNLTTLAGAPKRVGGEFNCSVNHLETLIGAPKEVGGAFICRQNDLLTIEGAPEKVGDCFWCDTNPRLVYDEKHFYGLLPKIIGNSLIADDSKCDYELAGKHYITENLKQMGFVPIEWGVEDFDDEAEEDLGIPVTIKRYLGNHGETADSYWKLYALKDLEDCWDVKAICIESEDRRYQQDDEVELEIYKDIKIWDLEIELKDALDDNGY